MRGMEVHVDQYENLTPRGKRIMKPLIWLGILNAVAFLIGFLYLGGGAHNDGKEHGAYYVSDHAHRTEVTRGQFIYSQIHTYCFLATTLLPTIAYGILYLTGNVLSKPPNP